MNAWQNWLNNSGTSDGARKAWETRRHQWHSVSETIGVEDKGHAEAAKHAGPKGYLKRTNFVGGYGFGHGGQGWAADNGKVQIGVLKSGKYVRQIESDLPRIQKGVDARRKSEKEK